MGGYCCHLIQFNAIWNNSLLLPGQQLYSKHHTIQWVAYPAMGGTLDAVFLVYNCTSAVCHSIHLNLSHHVFALTFVSECDIRMDFDTNEYPNIFVSRKWHERISEYIRIKILIQTNIRINIWIGNIRIFEYIRHSLD